MFQVLKGAAIAAVAMALVACGGGGSGNYSTGGTYFTHDQLAQEFIRRVNVDVAGYNLTLVKVNTLQTDYIVVYDNLYGTYDAYWLGNYNPGESLASYLYTWDQYFYYDLISQGGNLFKDPVSGYLFTKTVALSKDSSKNMGLYQEAAIRSQAKKLELTFGLKKGVALETARFAFNMKNAAPGTFSASDYDAFTKENFGSSITEIQNDYKAGNTASLNSRVELAGQAFKKGAAGAEKFVQTVFFGEQN